MPYARKPLPLERSVLWVPRGLEAPEAEIWPEPGSHAVFLQHGVVAGVARHLEGDETEARFGFLLGHLRRCPESARHYLVVDTAVAARETLDESDSGSSLIRAWTEAQSVFSGHSGLLVGWYHSHRERGPVPSDADLDTMARYFSAPWQFSIVAVPSEAEPLGGVFRHDPARGDATPRPMPFYELFGEPHGGDLAGLDSAMNWSNYEYRSPESREPPREAPTSAPEEPVAGDRRRTAAPRMTPWVESANAAEEAVPEAEEAVPKPGAGRPKTVARPSPGSRAGSDRPAAVPLVIPGEGEEGGLVSPRARRISWPMIAGAACLLVIALFFLLSDRDGGPVVSSPPATGSATAVSPDVRSFLDEVEALEIAGERYAERAADFDAGRIGCDLLTTGYVAADEAYIRIAASYRDLGDEPNPRATAAYETAGEEIATVNSHFDESGCPRP